MKKSDRVSDYHDYLTIQKERSIAKWHSVSFDEKMFIKTLLSALPEMIVARTHKVLRPDNICCMGIRNGNEYNSLKKYQASITEISKSKIFGVDLTPYVEKVGDNCFAYDFNKLPKDWLNKFDFIYSNSIDHSYNIQETITEWHRLLKNDRYMLLQMSTSEKVCSTDIYSFKEDDCLKLFSEKMFEIMYIWKEYKQKDFFNVLLRIIK